MMTTLLSCTLNGLTPSTVRVEVDLSSGLPGCQIVGLPDSAVQESRDRIRAAIKNSGFEFPLRRITVNLAPADQKKEGAGFDLAIALGILGSSGQIPAGDWGDFMVLGELGLDGSVRPIPGILAMVDVCGREGPRRIVIPRENTHEATVAEGVSVWTADSLREAAMILEGEISPHREMKSWEPAGDFHADLKSVRGQAHAKRALEVAAAGHHNLLLIGPPGSGKTMLAARLPGLLPPLTFGEALEISKIRSVAGLLGDREGLARCRPFRSPHSTISYAGMVGGGNPVRPGELSLAHRGVLFMDEFPEFYRNVLESLRQPLEEKSVSVVRMSGAVTYPADFLFVGAMNPCPCGYYGDLQRDCLCRPVERLQYRKRISGPLLDRIDLHIEVARLPVEKLHDPEPSECSQTVRARVLRARALQSQRYGEWITNGRVDADPLERGMGLTRDALELLKKAYEKLHFSARGYMKVLRVGRTIADLEGSGAVEPLHVAEALQYRPLDRTLYA